MIDYFALALGHGLLVLAFLRLVTRDSLDTDPAIKELKEAAEATRPNPAQRRASRRAPQSKGDAVE